MALRKPLFMQTAGFAEEMAAADSIALGGLSMSGDIAMGTHKVTGLAQASATGDALAWGRNASVANLTVTGALAAAMSAGSFKITSLAQASATGDALAWGRNASVANFAVTGALTADMAAGTHKITGLAQASGSGDALAWGQNASVANLTVTGTLGADMAAGTHKITGLAQASASGDALGWGQNASVNNLTVTGALGAALAAGGFKITGLADPSAAQDAATKAYVDAVKTGLDFKDSVRAISLSNITLSGTQTVDGVALVAGNRVLVAGQTAAKDNGIYVVAAGAWSRASDADNTPGLELGPGAFTFVEEGTLYKDCGFVMTSDDPFTLGTSACNWVQFSSAGVIQAGDGLSKTGNTLAVKTGAGIKFDGSKNVVVDYDTSTLQISGTSVAVKPDGTKGIQTSASGVGVKLQAVTTGALAFDGSGALGVLFDQDTIDVNASGQLAVQFDPTSCIQNILNGYDVQFDVQTLKKDSSNNNYLAVRGVPSGFYIGNFPTNSTYVTRDNINSLCVNDPVTDANQLHRHSSISFKPITWNGTVSAGDPVFVSANNTYQKADAAVDAKRNVIGITGLQSDMYRTVSSGPCLNILSGATAGTKYYLAAGGGLTTTMPAAGNNVIQVGYAINATDLFVQIFDYGKRAA